MPAKLLQVGYISKAHGIKGEVMVTLETNITSRVSPGSVLVCEDSAMTVITSKAHKGKWIVQFRGVTTRNLAESLKGKKLFASPIEDASQLWVDHLIGLEVVDQNNNSLGRVAFLEANPASDLLVLESGHLIPLVFINDPPETVFQKGVIEVTLPEGLLESEF